MEFATLLEQARKFSRSTLTVRSGVTPPRTRTFPEVVDDALGLQACLREAGVQPGQCVGLHASNSYEFIIWDLALISLGAVPQVLPEEWPLSQVLKAASQHQLACTVSHLIGNLVLADVGELNGYLRVTPTTAKPSDPGLLTRVYSSGTTGKLKGLNITRRGAEDVAEQFVESFSVTDQDRYLFFLPLSHFQQRLSLYTCLASGVSIMVTPYTHVFHDIPRFKPSFMIAPPVFYEVALATLAPTGAASDGGTRLRSGFGENIRFMITGMAPTRRSVLEAFAAHGVRLLEAYGITEVGLIAWNTPEENRIGTVGRPLKNHDLKFTDEGEILVKALHPLSKGYFEAEAGDAERTFLPDGFIATGDIGEIQDSHVVLNGRRKDIIVTREGLKVHPAMLEEQVLACEVVRQAVVITDLYRNDIVVVASVDDPHNDETISALNRTVGRFNESAPSAIRISRTVITRTRFSVDNGLLTRNMKPNRQAISREFSMP